MADNRINFTKGNLDALPIPAKGERATYHDTKTPGLQLRVTSAGAKTFVVRRRVSNGEAERVTLGSYPAMTPEQARKKAAEVNATIAKGDSPMAEKRRARLEAKTVQNVLDDYLEARKGLKPRTQSDMRQALKEVCPDWLNKPLTRITADMVKKCHAEHGKAHSEARANLAMRYLRALFNYAMAEYQDEDGKPLVDGNPVKKLSQTRAWYKVERRQTVIKPHELGAWFTAVQALPGEDMRDYFVTVLLTGMRKQEAQNLQWGHVDLAGKTLTVVDPKNGRDHTLPLPDYLLALLSRRKAVAVSDYVFADGKGRRLSNFRYAQAAVEKASGVAYCIHDLRRTFATIAESLDIPAYALKRLLNHADGADVTAGYIVANVERLREPMQKITDYVLKAAGLKATAEVIELKQHRG